MPSTYEPIATQTLGSAAATITFSSIPATYTDLRLVLVGTHSASGDVNLQFNSDTTTNYSFTVLYGTGTAAGSYRQTNQTAIQLTAIGQLSTTIPELKTADIFSYAGSTFKTVLTSESNDQNGSGSVGNVVGLWRSTSAINTVNLGRTSGNFNAGTTATLYGIKNA